MPQKKVIKAHFKTSSRMPLLLGDELIPDPGYAVFELVKNAHDADATTVKIQLSEVDDPEDGAIVIRDNGRGMDRDTLVDAWLVMGTTLRRGQSRGGLRTPGYGRPLLGEKGIGRFAAHKLGDRIRLVTRMRNEPEYVVTIDWTSFDPDAPTFLEDVPVRITERDPVVFTGRKTGTKIKMTGLRSAWGRGMVRNLHRDITSISSPFDAPGEFHAELTVKPQADWLRGLFSFHLVERDAPFVAKCHIRGSEFEYSYRFKVPPSFEGRLEERNASVRMAFTPAKPHKGTDPLPYRFEKKELDVLDQLGEVELRLLMFELSHDFVRLTVQDQRGFKRFLAENGGIRVYRGGIRVFGLGGTGEDWLNLGGRRVQLPAARLSNNQVIGAVLLKPDSAGLLREQTNRRGFTENLAFTSFKKAVLAAIAQIEAERFKDKERIKAVLSGRKVRTPVLDELTQLRESLRDLGPDVMEKVGPAVARVETAYEEIRETLLNAAGYGLSVGGLVHDVDKQVRALLSLVRQREPSVETIRTMVQQLASTMEGLTFLLRKSTSAVESLKNLVDHAIASYDHRFTHHGITIENGFSKFPDLRVRCVRRFVLNTIMNLLDNSIWWLNIKGQQDKRIYVGPSRDLEGPALVIADSGPGFLDPPEDLVRPFFSRKEEGMGLGLYLADETMRHQEGRLAFPGSGDVALPDGMEGAVVALVFPKEVK
jgi:signal transduction histidine kinase